MKKLLLIVLGLVGVMILAVSPVFGSQIIGTPLYTDPDVHERITGAPLPRGYRFGRALPPSIDLEVEWKPIGAGDIDRIHRRRIFIGDEDMYRSIRGIFIDRGGTIRVVDIHPRAMRGMRLWRSDNLGKNWRVERETMDAWKDKGVSLVGREKGEVLFEADYGSRRFQNWPLEVEELLKTEFRGLYEQRAKMSSALWFFLAKDPKDEGIMIFCTVESISPMTIVRIFVTVDGGEGWMEINSTEQTAWVDGRGAVYPGGLAIKKRGDTIRVFVGQMGSGPRMIQVATLNLSELEKVLTE